MDVQFARNRPMNGGSFLGGSLVSGVYDGFQTFPNSSQQQQPGIVYNPSVVNSSSYPTYGNSNSNMGSSSYVVPQQERIPNQYSVSNTPYSYLPTSYCENSSATVAPVSYNTNGSSSSSIGNVRHFPATAASSQFYQSPGAAATGLGFVVQQQQQPANGLNFTGIPLPSAGGGVNGCGFTGNNFDAQVQNVSGMSSPTIVATGSNNRAAFASTSVNASSLSSPKNFCSGVTSPSNRVNPTAVVACSPTRRPPPAQQQQQFFFNGQTPVVYCSPDSSLGVKQNDYNYASTPVGSKSNGPFPYQQNSYFFQHRHPNGNHQQNCFSPPAAVVPFHRQQPVASDNGSQQTTNASSSGVANAFSGPTSDIAQPRMVDPSCVNNGGFVNGNNNGLNANVKAAAMDQYQKRRAIQKQLILLLHSQRCLQRNNSRCNLPYCANVKTVLRHMSGCMEASSCPVPSCLSSRKILAHYKECQILNKYYCDVCNPVTNYQEKCTQQHGNNDDDYCTNEDNASVGGNNVGVSKSVDASVIDFEVKDYSKQREGLKDRIIGKLIKAALGLSHDSSLPPKDDPDAAVYSVFAKEFEEAAFLKATNFECYSQLVAIKIYEFKKEYEQQVHRTNVTELRNERVKSIFFNALSSPTKSCQHSIIDDLKNIDSVVPPNRLAPMAVANRTEWEDEKQCKEEYRNPSSTFEVKSESPTKMKEKSLLKLSLTPESPELNTYDTKTKIKLLPQFATDMPRPERYVPSTNSVKPTNEMTRHLFLKILNDLSNLEEYVALKESLETTTNDLSKITERVERGEYDEDPWKFCNEMSSIFDNAMLNSRKNSRIYKCCAKISESFIPKINEMMKSIGYCCGRHHTFSPLALICYGQPTCSIPRDADYYWYKSDFGTERYTYCKKCFDDIQGDAVCLTDDLTDQSADRILKKDFKQSKNDEIVEEKIVECVECKRKFHSICVLHVEDMWSDGYTCENCLEIKKKNRPENRFTAKQFPTCTLSELLESRVNNYLREKNQTGAGVIIRVLANTDKEVEVKPLTKAKYCSIGELPEKFPYRSKMIVAFQAIDGVEVAFFGLYVQEYDDKAPPPNSRRVYISYLDSVNFYQPKHLRTDVYREILLSYLEHCKFLGYTMAHVWACPPNQGDDYIFNCHPSDQRMPKAKRLQEWYKSLFDLAIQRKIIVDYKDIFKHVQDEGIKSVTELPYFDGDYWTNVIEDSVKECNENGSCPVVETLDSSSRSVEESAPPSSDQRKVPKGLKRKKSRKQVKPTKKAKKFVGILAGDVGDKICGLLEKHKEIFFVVKLCNINEHSLLKNINDSDALVNCELMENRDLFLSKCRENHWEFSTLRRAKYSTMALCYELHSLARESYHCNICQTTDVAWHCTVCVDFDLCHKCYAQGHEHEMKRLTLPTASASVDPASASGANRKMDPQQLAFMLNSLEHANRCRNANCTKPYCKYLRRYLEHCRSCCEKPSECAACRMFTTHVVVKQHAGVCQLANCNIPFCARIRKAVADQEILKRKKRERELMYRMNLVNAGGSKGQQRQTVDSA